MVDGHAGGDARADFESDDPQATLEGFDVLTGTACLPTSPNVAQESLALLAEVMTQIRFLATHRPDGALSEIEILASAMCKTPRLLAERCYAGSMPTLRAEQMAGHRALSIGHRLQERGAPIHAAQPLDGWLPARAGSAPATSIQARD